MHRFRFATFPLSLALLAMNPAAAQSDEENTSVAAPQIQRAPALKQQGGAIGWGQSSQSQVWTPPAEAAPAPEASTTVTSPRMRAPAGARLNTQPMQPELQQLRGGGVDRADRADLATFAGNPPIEFPQPDGSVVKRYLNGSGPLAAVQRLSGEPTLGERGKLKKTVVNEMEQGQTTRKTARLALSETVEMNVMTPANQFLEYTPGLIYNVRDLYSGNVYQNAKFVYGENRAPVTMFTSVQNVRDRPGCGAVNREVPLPDLQQLQQTLADFNNCYTVDPERTRLASFRWTATEVYSKSEFALSVGASARYFFASAAAKFGVQNKQEFRQFFVEGVKELYTVRVTPPQNGFFTADPGNVSDLGYISAVTYGVRVVGLVTMENTEDASNAAVSAGLNIGVAEAEVNMETLSRTATASTKIQLYAVGGQSRHAGAPTNLREFQSTVNDLLSGANYPTAAPIQTAASTLDGRLISFHDATDNFTYDEYKPAVLVKNPDPQTVTVSAGFGGQLLLAKTAGDMDAIYGGIQAKAYFINSNGQTEEICPDNQAKVDFSPPLPIPGVPSLKICPQNGTNVLWDVLQPVGMAAPNLTQGSNLKVGFEFQPHQLQSGYVDLIVAVVDEDANMDWADGDDDAFVFLNRGGAGKWVQNNRDGEPKWCRQRFWLGKAQPTDVTQYREQLTNGDDQIDLSVNVQGANTIEPPRAP